MARPARDPDAVAPRRIQMDLSPRAIERLQRLQTRIDAASYAETTRRSLWVHETLLDLMADGGSLFVEKDGVMTKVTLVGSDA